MSPEQLDKAILRYLPEEEGMMNLERKQFIQAYREQGIQEGRQEGKQQGLEQGRLEGELKQSRRIARLLVAEG